MKMPCDELCIIISQVCIFCENSVYHTSVCEINLTQCKIKIWQGGFDQIIYLPSQQYFWWTITEINVGGDRIKVFSGFLLLSPPQSCFSFHRWSTQRRLHRIRSRDGSKLFWNSANLWWTCLYQEAQQFCGFRDWLWHSAVQAGENKGKMSKEKCKKQVQKLTKKR